MVFSSSLFLFAFLPLTLLVYNLVKGNWKNHWLLLVSLVFFGWSQPHYLWLIICSIGINYFGALLIHRFENSKKPILSLTLAANLGILLYYKYFTFAVELSNQFLSLDFIVPKILLPIGISFFTFQAMSYTVDVYRGEVAVQKDFFKVALYIVLFPQLIAGPIVRYKDVEIEIVNRSVNLEDFAEGLERFLIGLGKKVLLANNLGAVVDAIWAQGAGNQSFSIAWLGVVCYGLQIYFDFSGYSDMAIGLGRLFGFHFLENFNLPYISKSMTEFWRRWHISLSTWFRDYLYIPLGGNRKHVYQNLIIVFFLTGLWHGAALNFVLWGLWNGFFLIIERLFRKNTQMEDKRNFGKNLLAHVYTLLVVAVGWVFFRTESIKEGLLYVRTLFGLYTAAKPGFALAWYLDSWTSVYLAAGIFFSTTLPQKLAKALSKQLPEIPFLILKYLGLLALFLVSVLQIVSGSYNPFIYFQF